jgi:hypothetical protein
MKVTTKESPSFGSNGTDGVSKIRQTLSEVFLSNELSDKRRRGKRIGRTDEVLGDDVDEGERADRRTDFLEHVHGSEPTESKIKSEDDV